MIQIQTKFLKSKSDTLRLSDGFSLTAGDDAFEGRVFAVPVSCPEKLPAHLKPAQIKVPPVCCQVLLEQDAGTVKPVIYSPVNQNLKKTSAAEPGWHYYVTEGENWLQLPSVKNSSANLLSAHVLGTGLYGLFGNSDSQKPVVDITSRGQHLLQDDFIPQNAPIEITLRDDAGVDFFMRKPSVFRASGPYDSTSLTVSHSGGLSKTGLIRLTPNPELNKDSIEIRVSDISGNEVRVPFKFQYGNGLRIKISGNYPNPFSDTTVIVYQLTDWVEEVNLKIYSRSGRLVRTFSDNPESGYKEIVWDGKSQSGAEIANGLYYLKITAKRKGKKVSGTLKLFKKKQK